jgi:tetratricopeptide (TPR) repeat protein
MLNWFFGSRTLDDHIKAGDYKAALNVLKSALEIQPSEPALLELKAQLLAKSGEPIEAGKIFLQVADYFSGRGFGMRAIAILKQAQALDPPPPGLEAHIANAASLALLDDVASSPLFNMFSRDELITVIQRLKPKSFDPGEILLVEGKPGDSMFVIASGEVRVYATDVNGWPKQLSIIEAPAFFGEIAVLRKAARTATVIAASHVNVLELSLESLEEISVKQPRIREVISKFASNRQQELDRHQQNKE